MKSIYNIIFAALIIGVVGGYMAGKSKGNGDSESDNQELSSSDKRLGSQRAMTKTGSSTQRSKRVRSVKEALQESSQKSRISALVDYFSRLNQSRFEEEADKLTNLSSSDKMMVSYLLFSHWAERDPYAAAKYTSQLTSMKTFVNSVVFKSWAASNPEEAAAYFETLPAEPSRRGIRPAGGTASLIASEWALTDPDAAMAWASSLQDSNSKYQATSDIIKQIAESDPASAVLAISSIEDKSIRGTLQQSIASIWAKKDWDAAYAWISTLPAGEQNASIKLGLIGLTRVDPEAALAKLSLLSKEDDYNQVMKSAAHRWSEENPEAAAKGLLETGNRNQKFSAVLGVVSGWVDKDADEAFDYINGLEQDDFRNQAVRHFISQNNTIGRNDMDDIRLNLKLAESVSDPEGRISTMGLAMQQWARADKKAAIDYINRSDLLSEEDKKDVITRATLRSSSWSRINYAGSN